MPIFRKRHFGVYIKAIAVLICGLCILPPSYAEPIQHTKSTLRAPLNKDPVGLIVATLCNGIPMALEDFYKSSPCAKLTSIDQILPPKWLDSIEKEHKIIVQLGAGDIYISTEPNSEGGGILIRIDAGTGSILDSEGFNIKEGKDREALDETLTSTSNEPSNEKPTKGTPSKFRNKLITFPSALLLLTNLSLATIQPPKTQGQQGAISSVGEDSSNMHLGDEGQLTPNGSLTGAAGPGFAGFSEAVIVAAVGTTPDGQTEEEQIEQILSSEEMKEFVVDKYAKERISNIVKACLRLGLDINQVPSLLKDIKNIAGDKTYVWLNFLPELIDICNDAEMDKTKVPFFLKDLVSAVGDNIGYFAARAIKACIVSGIMEITQVPSFLKDIASIPGGVRSFKSLPEAINACINSKAMNKDLIPSFLKNIASVAQEYSMVAYMVLPELMEVVPYSQIPSLLETTRSIAGEFTVAAAYHSLPGLAKFIHLSQLASFLKDFHSVAGEYPYRAYGSLPELLTSLKEFNIPLTEEVNKGIIFITKYSSKNPENMYKLIGELKIDLRKCTTKAGFAQEFVYRLNDFCSKETDYDKLHQTLNRAAAMLYLIHVREGELDHTDTIRATIIKNLDTQSLINILTNDDENVRAKAAEILGKIGDKQAVEPLIKLLEDKSESVRIHVATALGLLNDARAVKPLFYVYALEDESKLFQKAAEDALIAMKEVAVEPLCQILYAISPTERLFGEGLHILAKICQSSKSELVLKSLTVLIPQIKETIKTNDIELVENGFFVFNVLLASKEVELKIRKEIWDIYYSFISQPYDFPFFVDPAVPPIFKSVTTNSIGFTLVSVLKGPDFSEQREECLGRLIGLSQERIKSKDRTTYMLGRFLAYNLSSFLYEKDIELAQGIKEGIEELNKINMGPDASIFEDNVVTVKIYFQERMKENIWTRAYINKGYGFESKYTDNTVRIFEKKDTESGRILKVIIPRAPQDSKDFKGSIFEDFNKQGEYDVDYLIYNGHAGMGTELEESFKNAQAYFKAPIIQLASCWSKNNISKIQKLFPWAAPILTETGAMSLDGLLIFAHTAERLLRDGENATWRDIRTDIDDNAARIKWDGLYFEEKKGNRIFPDEGKFREISDIDGDGTPDINDPLFDFQVAREFRNNLNFNFTPVSDRETPEDKASDVIGIFSQYLSDDPFLERHNICIVNPDTEGLNKGWFWPWEDTKEPMRIRNDYINGIHRYLISLNIGYRELSQESLMLMGLVEAAKYIGEQFKEGSLQAIMEMEKMLDIKREKLNEERLLARELAGISLEDTKEVFKKLGITTEDEKAQIVNPLRGFLVGMEYIEKKYKLAQRTIAHSESTDEERELARVYIEGLKNLYGQFLEKYNFPEVPFEDMIKLLDISKNNPTIWYLAYLVKNGINIPDDIGEMNEMEIGASTEMGMVPQSWEDAQLVWEDEISGRDSHLFPYNLATDYIMGITSVPETDIDDRRTPLRSKLENERRGILTKHTI